MNDFINAAINIDNSSHYIIDEKLSTLPILLRNPKILLIGGGKVALQKAEVLKNNEIEFHLIAENIIRQIIDLDIPCTQKAFEKNDLTEYNIIVDATGNPEVNRIIEEEKEKRFLFLNTVDVPEKCDFYFSALLNYGRLKIAVSSDGASPTLAQHVRNRIKKVIPVKLNELSHKKYNERKTGIIDIEKTKREAAELFGKVYIVGCGVGDPDLLTIKALRVIEISDVVLYDALISKEIIDLIPPHVQKIYCGKPHGSLNLKQEEINQLLVHYAKEGKIVSRLKSGDPFVFGRLVEETTCLIENEINFEIIPGISSAIAGPASAGIPLTLRDVSAGFSVVAGCLKGNKTNCDWIKLLKIEKHTVIVLMGLKKIDDIISSAIDENIPADYPVAIISNASRENQKNIFTTLGGLKESAKLAETPAILVFGEVVNERFNIEEYSQAGILAD